jgi:hypothetical protein
MTGRGDAFSAVLEGSVNETPRSLRIASNLPDAIMAMFNGVGFPGLFPFCATKRIPSPQLRHRLTSGALGGVYVSKFETVSSINSQNAAKP